MGHQAIRPEARSGRGPRSGGREQAFPRSGPRARAVAAWELPRLRLIHRCPTAAVPAMAAPRGALARPLSVPDSLPPELGNLTEGKVGSEGDDRGGEIAP